MNLNYDIDILPKAESLNTVGRAAPGEVHYAAFRDPATVEAARRAGPRTVAVLADAGLSMETYSSGAPAGHYPLGDEAARDYLMACVVDAITSEAEEDAEDIAPGDFDLSQFLVALSAARPFGALVPLTTPPLGVHRLVPKASVYVAISVLAAAGYVAGFALFG